MRDQIKTWSKHDIAIWNLLYLLWILNLADLITIQKSQLQKKKTQNKGTKMAIHLFYKHSQL